MPHRRLRVAVVGAGYVAHHHLAALARLPFVDVVAVCDTNLEAARAVAARFGIPAAARGLGAMDVPAPDAVHVLTPPATHAAIATEALAMGCHVLVEKPLADSVGECAGLVAAARAAGRTLAVNHSDLLDPMVERALDAVRAGRIGEVIGVDVFRSSDYPPYPGGPLPALVTQGSYAFRDLGVHGLYTIRAFLGDLASLDVRCQSLGAGDQPAFDEWQATVVAARGVGRILLSWNARPLENRLVVRGTRGTIDVDRFLQTFHLRRVLPGPKFVGLVADGLRRALGDAVRIPSNVLRFATGRLKPSPGIQRGAELFARAVHEGRTPPFPATDALAIAELLDQACVEPDRARHDALRERLAPLPPADALVTGAAGFLGRALVARLRARGQVVRVLVRGRVAAFDADAGIQSVFGNLGDPRTVDHAVAGVGTVFHVGAAMRGAPADFEAGTVWGTRNIVASCIAHASRRLVYVSSLGVLDHAGRDRRAAITECSPLEPHPERRGAYTRTKLAAELIVRAAIRDQGLPAVILRPGQIFGPGAEQATPNGVLALAGRWISVGDGRRSIPLVFVEDVVDAIERAGVEEAALGRTIHVVDPEPVSRDAYLQRYSAWAGPSRPVLRVPAWAFLALGWGVELLGKVLGREVPLSRYRVRSLCPLDDVDTTASQELLGWTPGIGVNRGLDATFGQPAKPAAADPAMSPDVRRSRG